MQDNRILNALSYFSVIFAPFLVPIIIWILGKDEEVKHHAKRALISHIIPLALMIILIIAMFVGIITEFQTNFMNNDGIALLVLFVLLIVTYLISFVWNIFQGIKVIMK
jgi:cytochrome c biogenesis factor